ncbi:MAG: hypothetical protein J6A29_03955 [Clostridia bacterium]|nr:hypothetical protein [Clostridia bacterium]
MNNNQISDLLIIVLMIAFLILVVLVCALLYLKYRSIKTEQKRKTQTVNNKPTEIQKSSTYKDYSKQSIFNFMEFDKVVDNMICQKNGFRYLMVVSCQGVNYDLMSVAEKLSVEQGFVEFLNTLRHPIQIYTQTRTVNLENSVQNYKRRVKEEEDKLNKMKLNYEQMVKSGAYSNEEIQKAFFELTKQTNLCEYGKDIIANTERMSLNKNVLNKQYYIIVPYYPSELGANSFDKEEIQNIAFSELYTRAQSIVRTLSACGVTGKIMNSNELVELLYMAYNRDEAEIFGVDKILRMGYDELYSTAPDVLDKKSKELDRQIEEKAFKLAQQKVYEVKSEKQKRYETKVKSIDDLIDETAKMILDENEQQLGQEVTKKAKKKIDEDKEKRTTKVKEGKQADEKVKKTRTRKTSSNAV